MKLSINKVSLVWVVLTILVAVARLFVGEEQINPYKMNTRTRIVQNEHNTELLCRYYSIVQLLVSTLLLYLTIAVAGYVPMYVFLICLPIIGLAIYSVYTKHKLSRSPR